MGFRDLFIQEDNKEDKKPLTTNVIPQKMPESFDKSIPMPTAIISSTVEIVIFIIEIIIEKRSKS